MDIINIKQAVIVEGKYDKIKLSSIINAVIIPTNGYGIFKDKEKIQLIRFYARRTGIIILTDSDSAGFKIRNHIKSIVPHGKIINVYIPDVFGKEKRKTKPSCEGKIGVEGIDKQLLIQAFKNAGIIFENQIFKGDITRLDLYECGLTGSQNSSALRKALLRELDLPELMSSSSLLEILNTMMDKNQLIAIIDKIKLIK